MKRSEPLGHVGTVYFMDWSHELESWNLVMDWSIGVDLWSVALEGNYGVGRKLIVQTKPVNTK